ncbi:MAG: hypothetical protein ACI97A_002343 [Planctomycetota bacterium]|jgi:hypothetical protein
MRDDTDAKRFRQSEFNEIRCKRDLNADFEVPFRPETAFVPGRCVGR